jgi:GNAT superfamily N-acetyltransferase
VTTVRLAEPADADAIARLLHAAFVEFKPLYTPGGFAATTPSADQIRPRFAEGPIWVAESGGGVVGTVAAVVSAGGVYVRSMAVDPAARGRGIAGRLLHAVERFAERERQRRLFLSTTPFLHAAIHLYEQAGFRRTGETSDLSGTPLLTMAKDL